MQIAALEIGCHRLLNDRLPITVLGLESLVVNLLEGVKVLVDQAPQIRRMWIAWAIKGRQFEAGQSHEQHATSRLAVGNRQADSWS